MFIFFQIKKCNFIFLVEKSYILQIVCIKKMVTYSLADNIILSNYKQNFCLLQGSGT